MPPHPIRMAFCITELDLGGAERALTQLVLGLDKAIWEPRVYCLGPEAHFAGVLRDAGIPVVCLNGRGIRSSWRVLRELTAHLRDFQPALLQTFLFHANVLGILAATWAKIPKRVTGHRVADRRSPWYGRCEAWIDRWVTRRVCVSRGVADYLAQDFGIAREKLSVIPNSVDPSRFEVPPADLSPYGVPSDAIPLLFVGRLEPQKGVDVLLATAASLKERHPALNWVLVGDGRFRGEYVRQVRATGLESVVHFLGPQADVPAFMRAAAGLVLPSRWEGMPNVVLEAMAAGLPVIATAVEGVVDLVESNRNGWVVTPDSVPALMAAVEEFLSRSDLRSQFARISQDIVVKEFTVDRMVRRYSDLYSELLA